MNQDKEPAGDAAQRNSPLDFGAFVITCADIVHSEARRLIRHGIPVEADDAEQQGMQILLEEKETILKNPDPALVRTILRRRLLTAFAVRPTASKRTGTMVSIDEILDGQDEGNASLGADQRPCDRDSLAHLSVESHEDDVVDRVSMEEMGDFISFMQEPTTPAARHNKRKRWLPRVQEFAQRRSAA